MKIYVVGTGGVGGYFGGLLAKAGNDVTLVARGDHAKAIKEHGLVVKSVVGDFVVKPVKVLENLSEITDPELILFCVKTYDSAETAKELSKVVSNNTIIITFQNGVQNDLEIKKYITTSAVYPGVAYVISSRKEPGMIEQTGGLRKLIFGDRENSKNLSLEIVRDLMVSAGIDASLSEDITLDLWKKFVLIVALSGMTAYLRSPIGKVLDDPKNRQMYEMCLKEAVVVARAENVNLPSDIFEQLMKTSTNTAPNSKSSLLVDIENGRRNEIETLNGALIRIAKKYSINVPVNEKINSEIKSLNSNE